MNGDAASFLLVLCRLFEEPHDEISFYYSCKSSEGSFQAGSSYVFGSKHVYKASSKTSNGVDSTEEVVVRTYEYIKRMVVIHTSTRLEDMLCAEIGSTIEATRDGNDIGLK